MVSLVWAWFRRRRYKGLVRRSEDLLVSWKDGMNVKLVMGIATGYPDQCSLIKIKLAFFKIEGKRSVRHQDRVS